ncbi:MAG: hypothetical protein ACI4BI_03945 [Anaerotardibacter sp.]
MFLIAAHTALHDSEANALMSAVYAQQSSTPAANALMSAVFAAQSGSVDISPHIQRF